MTAAKEIKVRMIDEKNTVKNEINGTDEICFKYGYAHGRVVPPSPCATPAVRHGGLAPRRICATDVLRHGGFASRMLRPTENLPHE